MCRRWLLMPLRLGCCLSFSVYENCFVFLKTRKPKPHHERVRIKISQVCVFIGSQTEATYYFLDLFFFFSVSWKVWIHRKKKMIFVSAAAATAASRQIYKNSGFRTKQILFDPCQDKFNSTTFHLFFIYSFLLLLSPYKLCCCFFFFCIFIAHPIFVCTDMVVFHICEHCTLH